MAKRLFCTIFVVCVAVALGTAPVTAQTCGPLDNGRLADVRFEGTVIQFDPVVEFREMVLTIGGPCEDIIRVFDSKEEIYFDIREIERVTDGQYTWQLKRVSKIDPGVQKKLQEARGTGEEDDLWWSFFQQGAIPEGPYTDSGSFTVDRGLIVDPNQGSEKSAIVADRSSAGRASEVMLAGALGSGEPSGASGGGALAPKVVLTNADGVIRNSLCVGFDCPNSPSFSDTTILMMENNTRIKFDDTSSINSFPRNDWEIEANSSLNGGQSYIGFNDCGQSSQGGCATDLVFAVEAGVRQNALYVESDGDIGVGTANPVVRMHLIDGDTPALRLEQDGSSGFSPQTWDVAGNETTFFIRDATNGSTLPFRIQPGADSNSIFIESTNDVGIGTSSPTAALHINRNTGSLLTAQRLTNNAGIQVLYDRTDAGANDWQISNFNTLFEIGVPGASPTQFSLNANGNLTIGGLLTELSSRHAKTNFESLDPRDVLARVSELPISVWTYKQDLEARHMGPMADDFYEAFGLGAGDGTIGPGDKAGVALAAIQGLYQELRDRDTQIVELRRQLEELSALNAVVEELRPQQ